MQGYNYNKLKLRLKIIEDTFPVIYARREVETADIVPY
jgi:hypothetical protein